MWNEVSPDGTLVWTSSGDDLLAYRAADISRANAAPEHAPIHSVRRLRGAVPPSGITGATFVDGRMLVAGQGGRAFRVYSIDLATGARGSRSSAGSWGSPRGSSPRRSRAGRSSWLIQPFNPEGNPPTYSPDHATLVSFRARAGALEPAARRAARRPAPAPGLVARAPLLPPLAPDGAAARLRSRRCCARRAARRDADRQARAPRARAHDHARAARADREGRASRSPSGGRRVLREDHRAPAGDAAGGAAVAVRRGPEAQSDRPPPVDG